MKINAIILLSLTAFSVHSMEKPKPLDRSVVLSQQPSSTIKRSSLNKGSIQNISKLRSLQSQAIKKSQPLSSQIISQHSQSNKKKNKDQRADAVQQIGRLVLDAKHGMTKTVMPKLLRQDRDQARQLIYQLMRVDSGAKGSHIKKVNSKLASQVAQKTTPLSMTALQQLGHRMRLNAAESQQLLPQNRQQAAVNQQSLIEEALQIQMSAQQKNIADQIEKVGQFQGKQRYQALKQLKQMLSPLEQKPSIAKNADQPTFTMIPANRPVKIKVQNN